MRTAEPPSLPPPQSQTIEYHAYGAVGELFSQRAPEVVLSGPAGTGKTYGCLQYVHMLLLNHPGAHALICRKTMVSLTESALVTYGEKVLHPSERVSFFGGSKSEPAAFRYPNGSLLMVGGFDKPGKVLSKEFDVIYVPQCEELTEGEWETLGTRLRYGVMPYQQLLGDCNPDAPTHWLRQRANRGQTVMLESRHEDNPAVTPEYLARLDALTGVRRLRLRDGIWAAAEGMVYDGWDRSVHLVSQVQMQTWGVLGTDGRPNAEGVRSAWAGVDWGFTNAGVIGVWLEDGDGRLYRVREVYHTGKLIDWWIEQARALRAEWGIKRFICDPSSPANIMEFNRAGLPAVPGPNTVQAGINAVAERLQVAADGRPRIVWLEGAAYPKDTSLVERKLPTCSEEEVEGYVWDTTGGRRKGEEPVKQNDHGMDAARYVALFRKQAVSYRLV